MATAAIAVGVKRKRSEIEGPSRQFVCDCGRTFTAKEYLTRHVRSHSEQNAPPASLEGWKQHFTYTHIFGLPDGRVWSCAVGRFLTGTRQNGYVLLQIGRKNILRHCLNFEISEGRAITPNMEIDHIVAAPKPAEGCERVPQDDSWANLQELTSEEHRRKTAADNAGAGQKGGVTQGFPLLALHVATGKEDRHDSITAAALALGLQVPTIAGRLRQGSSKEYGGHVFRRCPEHLADQADMPGEVWKCAVYYDKAIRGVRVSNMGRVEFRHGRRTRGTILDGRHSVKLRMNNEDVTIRVYNLVAHTFLGSPPTPKHTVDHIDGDCLHDFLTNLRWATPKEQGRNQKSNKVVSKYDLHGELLDTYGTITEAAEKSNLSRQQVAYAARTGSTRTGFLWKVDERVVVQQEVDGDVSV